MHLSQDFLWHEVPSPILKNMYQFNIENVCYTRKY